MSSTENVCNHVKVFIRVRPENAREKNGKHYKVVHVADKHMLVFDPKEEEVGFLYRPNVQRWNLKNKNKDLQFVFDRVFDDTASQLEIFEETKCILESVFNGYNCTVFAYGATGSGKTHTMLGSSEKPGVMYQTMKELYNRIEQLKNEKSCDVAVSYLEVYNEEVRDLLTNSRSLAVREDGQSGVVIQGLTLHKPTSSKQLLQMLDYGNKNRTQHPTDANANSSRSHAVFQIYLRQQDRTANINQNIKIAKMCLVDLAGSERISSMNMKAARFREGANINRSLLALGNVINALTDSKEYTNKGFAKLILWMMVILPQADKEVETLWELRTMKRKAQHIPYRNSKLTRLLKDSLGGNCQTIMIATISPSSLSYEDTYNTLKYANRAKDIKSSVKSNVLNLNNHVGKYAQICEEQRKEIVELKEKLKAYESERLVIHSNHRENILLGVSPKESEIKRFKGVLENIFCKRQKMRINCLDLELKMKEVELMTFYSKEQQQRVQLFACEPATGKASCKYERKLAALKAQYNHIQQKIKTVEKMLEENSNWLHRVENEIRLLSQDGKIPQVLKQELQCCHLKMEVMDLKQQIQHMTHLFCLHKPVNRRTEKLINTLLPAFHQQYQTLKKAGLALGTAEDTFLEVEQLLKDWNENVLEDQVSELPEKMSDQSSIATAMNFSQHTYCPVTPCGSKRSSSLHRRTVEVKKDRSPDQLKLPVESKDNLPLIQTEDSGYPGKSSRRRLEQSLTCSHSDDHATPHPVLAQQNDLLFKEGFAPITYTPGNCSSQIEQISGQLLTTDLQNQKAECLDEEMEDNLKKLSDIETVISGMSENPANITYDLLETSLDTRTEHPIADKINYNNALADYNVSRKQSTKTFLQRLGLPSLLSTNETQRKPSYMSLTSAARRKRKSACFMGQRNGNVGVLATKRMRQDVPPAIGNKTTQVVWPGPSQNSRVEHLIKRKYVYQQRCNK